MKFERNWVRFPTRYVICLQIFFGLTLTNIFRFCLSISLPEMVVSPPRNLADEDLLKECPYNSKDFSNSTITGEQKHEGRFSWDEKTQGLLLSSFAWGYIVVAVPCGVVTERLGGKIGLGVSLLIPAVGCLLTPSVTQAWGAWGLIAIRVLMGIGQGFVEPSVGSLLARWSPVEERGRMGAFVYPGSYFGNIVNFSVSGLVLSWTGGAWANVFYLWGFLGLIWVLVWAKFGYDKPGDHPGLNPIEKEYLAQYTAKMNIQKDPEPTPWRGILTSVPLWGLVAAQIGHDWATFTIDAELPKYMTNVIHFSIAQTGLVTALPHVALVCVSLVAGPLVDCWLSNGVSSLTTTRKIFASVAAVGPSLGILGATFSGCNKGLTTASLVVGIGLMGFFFCSAKVNGLELSPNHAATIMSLIGTAGIVTGIIAPYLTALLIPNNTIGEWRRVFVIVAVILNVTNLIYVGTGSAEVQPWNGPPPERAVNLRET